MNSCKFSENCVPISPAVQELRPIMCPCKERFFCCTLSFVGSTVFECEPCTTCRIMETRESVQNFAPSPKITLKTTYWAAPRRAKPAAVQQDFYSTLVTLHICGLIFVVDVDLVTLASLSHVKKSGRIQY